MGIHFPITADNAAFLRTLESTRRGVESTAQQIKGSGIEIEGIFTKMKNAALGLGAAFSAQQIAREVVNIRGQFQQLEVAFTTMLGSAEKAQALMSQLTRTAAITPFGLQDVADGAKSLLAYGIAAEDVNGTLIKLGDIAAGLSIPLNDLVYLYGTTMVQGRMYTQDLRQFMGRGIPIVEALADTMGIAQDKVQEFVTDGKVGSKELVAAIDKMTAAGGKFGGLMEAQSKTITGQISNIEDAMDMMFNEIGKKSEGVINAALDGVSTLIANYEKVGEAIMVAVTAYGVYKGALMASIAIEKVHSAVLAEATLQKHLAAAAGIILSDAEAIAAAKTQLLTLAQRGLATALKSVAASTIANPYVFLAAAITTLAYATYKLVTYETEAEKAQKRLNEAHKDSVVEYEKERIEIDKLFRELKKAEKGSTEYAKTKDTIVKNYGKYLKGLDSEITSLNNVEAAYKAITKAAKESAKERALASVTSKEADVLAQEIGNQRKYLYDSLKRMYGDKRNEEGFLLADVYFDEIIAQYEKLGKISDEIRGKHVVEKWVQGGYGQGALMRSDYAEMYEQGMQRAQAVYDEAIKNAERMFGPQKISSSGEAPEALETKTLKERREQAVKEYNASLKAKEEFLKSDKKLTEEDSEKQLKDLNEQIKAAKKKAELYGADFSQKAKDKEKKSAEEQLKQQRANQQAYIDLLEEGSEKKLKQIDLNLQKEIDAYEKYVSEYGENEESIYMLNIAYAKHRKETSEVYREEAKQMQLFLREYGTFQQQKLAIQEEYAEKIKKAATEGEKMALEEQMRSELSDIEIRSIQQEIDWATIFDEFGGMAKDDLKRTLKSLDAYIKSDKFKTLGAENQKEIMDAYHQLEDKVITPLSDVSFSELNESIVTYYEEQRKLNELKEKEKEATEKLIKAKEDEAKGKGSKAETTTAKAEADKASKDVKEQMEIVSNSGNAMQSEAKKLHNTFKEINSVYSDLQSNSLKGLFSAFETISDLTAGKDAKGFMVDFRQIIGKAMGGVTPEEAAEGKEQAGSILGAIGTAIAGPMGGMIVEAIMGILDIFASGFEEFITNLQDFFYKAVEGIIDTIIQLPDIILSLLKGTLKALGNIANTLTFGAFEGVFGVGGNADEVNATINRLTERNERLQVAIEDLTESMQETSTGYTRAIADYDRAIEMQKELISNTLDIAKAQGGYSGSHHSWNYYWGGFTNEEMSWIKQNVKEGFSGDLYSLSPEEMKLLRSNADIWTRIESTGKGNYGGRLTEKLDAYIELAGSLEELTSELYEGLTGITFDGMYDSFVSSLMDMEYSAEEAADNISEMFMKAMLSNIIGDEYAAKLEEWYTRFGEAMRDDGTLSDDELNSLRNEYLGYVNEAISKRDELAKITGYGSSFSQEASTGGFASMSEDTGQELNGRFTALQMAGEDIKAQLVQSVAMMSNFLSTITNGSVIVDIRNLIALSNSHLEDIAKFAKITATYGEKLDTIIANTDRL